MRNGARSAMLLIASVLLGGCTGIASSGSSAPQAVTATRSGEILAVLNTQAQAWNRGDVDGFMMGYWHSDLLRFDSGDHTTFGWQATLDHYRARYPDRAAMGQLMFSDLSVELFSSVAGVVHGRWALKRDQDAPQGVFTLVFQKIDGDWKITSDHTS